MIKFIGGMETNDEKKSRQSFTSYGIRYMKLCGFTIIHNDKISKKTGHCNSLMIWQEFFNARQILSLYNFVFFRFAKHALHYDF
jgi:hypothetical protein